MSNLKMLHPHFTRFAFLLVALIIYMGCTRKPKEPAEEVYKIYNEEETQKIVQSAISMESLGEAIVRKKVTYDSLTKISVTHVSTTQSYTALVRVDDNGYLLPKDQPGTSSIIVDPRPPKKVVVVRNCDLICGSPQGNMCIPQGCSSTGGDDCGPWDCGDCNGSCLGWKFSMSSSGIHIH